VTWAQRESGTQYPLFAIAYGNGQFVAVGGDYNGSKHDWESTILTSADAVTWFQRGSGTLNAPLYSIAYGNGQFVATGQTGMVVSSADGTNWLRRDSGSQNATLRGVVFGNGQFLAVGTSETDAPGTILTSTDGVIWSQHPPPLSGNDGLSSIAYGNGRFVAVGFGGHHEGFYEITATSIDGLNWVRQQSPSGIVPYSIAYGNGQFVRVGGSIITSSDGVNWVQRQSGSGSLKAIAFGDGHFVAVGSEMTILQSGSIITLSIAPTGTGLLRVSLQGPTGLGYTVQRSTDLISWLNVTNITTTQPNSVILDALPAHSDHLFYRADSQ
jgi:hypothetical protein